VPAGNGKAGGLVRDGSIFNDEMGIDDGKQRIWSQGR